MSDGASLFEQLGGEPALRAIIDRFVERICDDMMIGFHFAHVDRQRLKEKEYEFAAHHLGAPVTYTGRSIEQAHAAHQILGGQFARRLRLLQLTLEEAGAPEAVRTHWLAHTESLRGRVTRDAGSDCNHDAALDKVQEFSAAAARATAEAVLATPRRGGHRDR